MIPAGFIDWSSPLQPELADAIVVLRVDERGEHSLARGVARELANSYGRDIIAWRRDEAVPVLPADPRWHRFPDEIPQPRQRVVAMFLDTIGWRALSRQGEMGARRYDGPSKAVCTYLEGLPFGNLSDRRMMPGFPDCSERLRWAPYAWRPARDEDLATL